MKIGLLGNGSQTLAVATTAQSAGDSLGPAIGVADGLPSALSSTEQFPDEQWQLLLEADRCDAVLVAAAGWTDERAEHVRTLVQAGRPLLLGHPACLSMLWAYELDMILADTDTTVIPFLPARQHPLVGELKQLIEASLAGGGPFGELETLRLERRQQDRSRDAVLAAFARDADLIRVLAGEPARLQALGSGGETAWATLAIGLSGPDQLPVRWQVAKDQPAGLIIELICSTGTICLEAPDNADWKLWQRPDADSVAATEPPQTTSAFDPGRIMLETLRHRLTPGPTEQSGIPPASWADAARGIEIAETVPRSLKKGRAIDLHQEEFSELGTFRGTMASLGCGIIMVGLFVLFLATLIGGVAKAAGWGFAERLAGIWPYAVLVTLLFFLALQLLPLLLPRANNSTNPPEVPPDAA
jgi:predicted dehydrogenase